MSDFTPPQSTTEYLLGRIDQKLDHLFLNQAAATKRHDDLDDRVTSLEGWRWYLTGISTAAGGLAAFIINKVL